MLQFGKIAVIGAGNVACTLCNVMKDKGINPYCVMASLLSWAFRETPETRAATAAAMRMRDFFISFK